MNLRLDSQLHALQRENAQLTVANAQTREQLQAAASPSSLEEVAREQGYTRGNEQIYVIVTPAATAPGSPLAAAGPRAAAAKTSTKDRGPVSSATATRPTMGKTAVASHQQVGGIGGVWSGFLRWWRNLWQ